MPMTCCPTCGLTVYSAAGHSTKDDCPQCMNELPPLAHSKQRPAGSYFGALEGFLQRTGRAQSAWLRHGL
jgi:hypothetical protein